MKITAEIGSWSSVVGSGVLLTNSKGKMIGQVAFLCHDDTLRDKDLQTKLAEVCASAINEAFK